MGWRTLTNEENLEHKIKVTDWDHGGVEIDLLRKEAMEIHRTLGYHLKIADNNTEVVKHHVSKSKSFNTAKLRSILSTRQKKTTYGIFVVPSISYPLRASTLSMADMKAIQKSLLPMICHGRHMHRNVNRIICLCNLLLKDSKYQRSRSPQTYTAGRCYVTTLNKTTSKRNS